MNLFSHIFISSLLTCKTYNLFYFTNQWTHIFQMKPEMLNEKVLVQGCQGKIEADLQAGHILSPYSLSLDMISCALSSLSHLQALTRARRSVKTKPKLSYIVILGTHLGFNCLLRFPSIHKANLS